MLSTSRRMFLAGAAALPAALAAGKFTKPIGLQLYTVRTLLPKDPRGTLAEVAKIGYASVEPGHAQMATLAPILKDLKLTTPSLGFELPLVTGDFGANKAAAEQLKGYSWEKGIEDAKMYGAKFMGISYISAAERAGGLEFYRKFADQMSVAGEKSRKAGLQLTYHHHSFEFEPINGTRPWDILVERFDKKAVKFEMDTFWAKLGGNDPVEMLGKLKGRVALMHLKDVLKGATTNYNEGKVAPDTFKEVGSGMLDFPAILKAADAAGAEGYIVEQDQWVGSTPLDSARKSYNYLRSL